MTTPRGCLSGRGSYPPGCLFPDVKAGNGETLQSTATESVPNRLGIETPTLQVTGVELISSAPVELRPGLLPRVIERSLQPWRPGELQIGVTFSRLVVLDREEPTLRHADDLFFQD